MEGSYPVSSTAVRRRTCMALLAFSACFGLATGVRSAPLMGQTSLALVASSAALPASPMGLASGALLPFLLAAWASWIGLEGLTVLVCLLKGFAFGLLGGGLGLVFGSAAWLVRLLLLFTDWICFPLLCWFCLRRFTGRRRELWTDLAVCGTLALLAVFLEVCVIAPFLASLL